MRAAQALALAPWRPVGHRDAVDVTCRRVGGKQADHHARDRRLAGAGFADEREGLALRDLEGDVVDGLEELAPAALDHPVEPGLRDVEDAARGRGTLDAAGASIGRALDAGAALGAHGAGVVDREVAGRCYGRRLASVPTCSGWIASGRSIAAAPKACGQRGLNGQPGGIADSRGIAPGICTSRSRLGRERRDRAHQAAGVGVQRVLHHVAHRADLGDAAGIHHRDAIGGLGDHAHVVGDQHDGGAVLAPEPLQERDDLRLHRDVERGRRLVGDDQLGLGAERERDHDALAHAAGELVRIAVDAPLRRRDADLGEELDRAPRAPRGREPGMGPDRLDELLADAVERVEAVSGSWKIMPMRLPRIAASPRAAGCRCARPRAGSRRRRSAPADR